MQVWVHWLFWTIVPFGPFISAATIKSWKPFLVAMSMAFGIGFTLGFIAQNDQDIKEAGQIAAIPAALVGGAMTQNSISEARKRTGIYPS